MTHNISLDWWGTRFIGWLCERMDMTNAMVEHAIRYPEMWIEAPFRPEMAEYCPKCGGKLLAMYGGGWDYDRKICGDINCKHEVEFETSTDVNE